MGIQKFSDRLEEKRSREKSDFLLRLTTHKLHEFLSPTKAQSQQPRCDPSGGFLQYGKRTFENSSPCMNDRGIHFPTYQPLFLMNREFIEAQLAKYNGTNSELHKDAVLSAIGFHVGLIKQRFVGSRLNVAQRQQILEWIRQFQQEIMSNQFASIPQTAWQYHCQWDLIDSCQERTNHIKLHLINSSPSENFHTATHSELRAYWTEISRLAEIAKIWLDQNQSEQ